MKNLTEKIKIISRHNMFLVVAVCIVVSLVFWLGCQSTTESPLTPDEQVNRAELNMAIKLFKSKVEEAVKDLDQQDAFKQELFNIGIVMAKGGTVNPTGAVVSMIGLLGLGSIVDNRKKDSLIKVLQNTINKEEDFGGQPVSNVTNT